MFYAALKYIFISIITLGLSACALPVMRTKDIPDSRIPLNTGVSDASFLTDMEKEVIVELNSIRANPKKYAEFLKSLRSSPQWSDGLQETIRFVEKKEPLPQLRASRGLSLAARNLVDGLGPEGLTGHTGKDGKSMLERMNCCGRVGGKFGEYLGYGYIEGAALAAQMAIDEGSADKEVERFVFDKDLLVVGVACGPHGHYRTMCAVAFATSYTEKPDTGQKAE